MVSACSSILTLRGPVWPPTGTAVAARPLCTNSNDTRCCTFASQTLVSWWEAQLDSEVEAIFARWKQKNPHVGFYAQLDVLIRANSRCLPFLHHVVEYAYNEVLEAEAED
jgi:hypothetical protein